MASLAGYTIPTPASYDVNRGHRGASFLMADGTIKSDLVNANAKRVFSLSWSHVTAAELANLTAAYDTLATNSPQTWTDHNGDFYSVTQDEGLPPMRYSEVNAAVARYNVTMTLREL